MSFQGSKFKFIPVIKDPDLIIEAKIYEVTPVGGATILLVLTKTRTETQINRNFKILHNL